MQVACALTAFFCSLPSGQLLWLRKKIDCRNRTTARLFREGPVPLSGTSPGRLKVVLRRGLSGLSAAPVTGFPLTGVLDWIKREREKKKVVLP